MIVRLRFFEEGEKTIEKIYLILFFQQKNKKLLFNYSPWLINIPETRKLFTVVNKRTKKQCTP